MKSDRWPREVIMRYAPLVLLVAFAAAPLLTSDLPTIGDGLNHFYRLAELERHITQGDLYPRWLANLHYGYGSPLFSFYAPLSYYLALPFHIAFPLTTSLQLGYVLALAVAISGAYAWAHDQFDSDIAGLACAAAYAFAPYLSFNIFHRGAYPETWGLALTPWVLWAALRVTVNRSRFEALTFALLYAALILTHTLTAFILTPLLLAYLVILLITRQREAALPRSTPHDEGSLRPSQRFLASLGMTVYPWGIWLLGLGLSSFFIIPLIFEAPYIQLNRTTNLFDLDYRNNFISLTTLFASPPSVDPYRVRDAMPASLSLGQAAFVIGSWLFIASRWLKDRRTFVFHPSSSLWLHLSFAIFFVVLCLLTLPFSQPLWALTPLAQFIQFPWRLVGPASLLLALLVGGSLQQLQQTSPRLGIAWGGLGMVSFLLGAISWTYHTSYAEVPPIITRDDTVRYELVYHQLGTTSNGEYLPKWVTEIPQLGAQNFTVSESSAQCQSLSVKLNEETIKCDAPQEFTLTLPRFYYPAWYVLSNEKQVEIRPAGPNGLISFTVPAGSQLVKVFLQPTLPQIVGAVFSLLALFATLTISLYNRR